MRREILKIPYGILNRLGFTMLPEPYNQDGEPIEVMLIEAYSYNRHGDVDHFDIMVDAVLKHVYGVVYGPREKMGKLETLYRNNTFISAVYTFLERIDIVVLNTLEDINFTDITYVKKDKEFIYLEVSYGK